LEIEISEPTINGTENVIIWANSMQSCYLWAFSEAFARISVGIIAVAMIANAI